MSWQQADPNSGGGTYSNYGNYNDGGADSASYDMFEVGETNEQPQQTATYSESGFGSGRSSAFYDPNAYTSEGTTHPRG